MRFSCSSPIVVEYCIGTFLKLVSLVIGQVCLLILCKDRDEENRELIIPVDVDDTSSATFTHSSPCKPELPESASPRHYVAAIRIGCDRFDDFRDPLRAE